MTIQDLGAIGELVGGIAVILSVLYLAIQIRHGLRGYQSVITQETTNHFSRLQLEVARDPVLADLLWRADQGAELTHMESFRLALAISSYMIAFENLYTQYVTQMLAEEAYQCRRGTMAAMLANPTVWHWWESIGKRNHPPGFVAEVAEAVRDYRANRKAT